MSPAFPLSGPHIVSGTIADKAGVAVENAVVTLANLTKDLLGVSARGGVLKTAADGSFAFDLANLGDHDDNDRIAVIAKYPGYRGMATAAIAGGYTDTTITLVREAVL
jgi:hypothetical protein